MSEQITNLIGTTWEFSTIGLIFPGEITYHINYTILCNNSAYNTNDGTALEFNYNSVGKKLYVYLKINTSNDVSFNGISGEGIIYESEESDYYLTDTRDYSATYVTGITITGGTDATNSNLISWLQANATQIIEEESISSFNELEVRDHTNYITLTIGENSINIVKVITPQDNPYLTFSSPNSFTLNVVDNKKYWDGTLEYSTDTTTWATWSGTSTISSISDGTKHNLYLRGTGNTYITGSSASSISGSKKAVWVLTGNNISCEGNIENLLDYQTVAQGIHPPMANYCYYYMFADCTSLTTAPELPATTLTLVCYSYMFQYCSSLTTAPELPATTLASYCYSYMFQYCTSLTAAPALPATTLVTNGYSGMFADCSSLTTVPELPATTLANGCYTYMFYDCTNLKLSTTQTGNYTKPYRIPTSGTGTTVYGALNNMFTSTGGTFTGTPDINTTYYLWDYSIT